jgi:hypothetical protein
MNIDTFVIDFILSNTHFNLVNKGAIQCVNNLLNIILTMFGLIRARFTL